jgi:hypothetical protein
MSMTTAESPRSRSPRLGGGIILAFVLVAAVVIAANVVSWSSSPDDSDPPADKAPPGRRIDVAVTISQSGGTLPIDFSVARGDRDGMVVVTVGGGTGCALLKDAQLYADGNNLATRLNIGEDPGECYAPYYYTARFEVPVNQMPAQPLLRGRPPIETPAT